MLAAAWAGVPQPALAQSPDEIASRIGTVARTMAAAAPGRWTLDATLAADVSRGNTDTANFRTTMLYVADSGEWRLGAYASAAYETTAGRSSHERGGLNVALARRLTPAMRLVLVEEIVQAPVDGLLRRNLLGAVAVWTLGGGGDFEAGVYGGAGWASEDRRGVPPVDYGAVLAGASATARLSEGSMLSIVGSLTQDASDAGHFKLGSSVSLKSAVTSVLGVFVSYAAAYDRRPAPGSVRANHALSAGLTLGLKGT